MRFVTHSALVLVFGVSPVALGCGGAETDCGDTPPEPKGQFQVEYSYVSGNCSQNPQAHPITLDPGNHGVNEIQMNRTNDRVEAIVVYKGCEVGVTYKVLTKPDEEAGMPSQIISYEEGSMMVISENELSGTVTRQEFDPPGTQTCTGEYDTTLKKNETTIGAATH